MCASSPIDPSLKRYAKKGARAASKGLRAIGTKLPRSAKELDETMQELLGHMPLADAAVMIAGFYAGYNSLTPMTMLLGGFKGLANITADVEHFALDPPLRGLLGISEADWHAAMRKIGIDIPLTEDQTVAQKGVNSFKLSMACIGLIEAYMITRPGAMAGVLNFVGQMAQATAEGIDALIPGG